MGISEILGGLLIITGALFVYIGCITEPDPFDYDMDVFDINNPYREYFTDNDTH